MVAAALIDGLVADARIATLRGQELTPQRARRRINTDRRAIPQT
jgi:hypothetical protein